MVGFGDFGTFTGQPFHFQADVMVEEISNGMTQMLVLSNNDADPWNADKIALYFQGPPNANLVFIHDAAGNSYELGPWALGAWYNFELAYDPATDALDVVMMDRAWGAEVADLRGLDVDPPTFTRVYLGSNTINNDGTYCTFRLDNVFLETNWVVPTTTSTWGEVKALFR